MHSQEYGCEVVFPFYFGLVLGHLGEQLDQRFIQAFEPPISLRVVWGGDDKVEIISFTVGIQGAR